MLVCKYETIFSISKTSFDYDIWFDYEIWSSFRNGQLVRSEFDENQKLEYTKLLGYSQNIMNKYLPGIYTKLTHHTKTPTGYTLYRSNLENKYLIKLHLFSNMIEIQKRIFYNFIKKLIK